MNMENRIRYLDKLLVWMMSFVMLVPTLLGFVGSLTTYAAASTTDNIVDAVLYEGPDGFATVQAVHDPEGQKMDWTVTLNKEPTPTPTYLQLEIDISGSGLQTPFEMTEHIFYETKENITVIQLTNPTLEADSNVLTFSTAIADSTNYDFSLNMLVQVIGDETSLAAIQTSPLAKTLNFSIPQPPNQVEQESSEIITSAPEEEIISEESVPPAEEEPTSEIIEEQPSEEVAESENIPEQESFAPEEKPNEVIHPPKLSEPQVNMNMIVPMALTAYNPDAGSLALNVQLTGSSINTHTIPVRLWTFDDYVYLAIKSTHTLDGATLRGIPLERYHEHGILEHIIIANTEFAPEAGLQGNTKDSRFTVFRIERSKLGDFNNPEYSFFVDGIGNGHDVGGFFKVIIPNVSADLTKTWVDGPMGAITVDLLRNGTIYETFSLTPAPGTNAAVKSWSTLPFTDATGVPYIYSAKENNPGEGYTAEFSSAYNNLTYHYTFTLVNTYSTPLMDIPVQKIWDDSNNQDGKRPPDLYVQLLQNGVEYQAPLLLTGPSWSSKFVGIPINNSDGIPYTYTLKELTIPSGYHASVIKKSDGTFEITNTYTPETTQVSGLKIWKDQNNQDGKRPSSVVVTLIKDGVATQYADTAEAPNWDYSFVGLPKYRDQGIEIIYTVLETAVPDYENPVYVQTGSGFDITNNYVPETVSIPVTKHWNDEDNQWGLRPPEVTIHLYQDDLLVEGQTLLLSDNNNWTDTFDNLPVYHSGGTAHVYRIEEVPVANYESSIDGYDIFNTLKVGSLEITKLDKTNPFNPILLDGAKFQLLNDKNEIIAEKVTEEGKILFDYLPYGTYTLVEIKAPEGYQLPLETWEIIVTSENEQDPNVKLTIVNHLKQVLPDTGGTGTLIFTLLGLSLMSSAVLLYIYINKNRKGRKKMSRITKFITAIFMAMMVMMGALQPLTASAAIAKPTTGDLIIHKRQFNGEQIPNIENHNGLEMTQPPGTAGLAGVTFNIYKVGDLATSTEIPTGATIADTGTTVTNGYLKFENLDAGRYLVVEDITNLPHGVNYTSPNFLVDVPMTNPEGSEWLSEVHVYPKNRLVLATIDLYKFFENKEANPDKTATFQLWKAGTTPVLMETKTVNTNGDGRILFNNNDLGYPVGDYYAIESGVQAPYGLNVTRLDFTVTTAHHDTTLADTNATIHLNTLDSAFKNYLLTDPEKTNTEATNPDFSANIGEIVNWNISVKLPANIAEYSQYTFTDDLDSKLDYVGNVTTKVDGLVIPSSVTPPAPGSESGGMFTVDFDMTDLALHGGKTLVISFDTIINETALMGEEIPNNFTLTFNNGSGVQTKTDPTPPYTQTGGAHFDKTSTQADITNFAGAQFWVYRMNDAIKEYLQADNSWSSQNATPRVLTSLTDGTFKIDGLAFGTYFLEERVALPGHMLPGRDFEFEVNASTHNTELPVNIENRPRITLPSTGGIGTVLFTIAGAGLMAGAVKLYKKEEKE